MKVSKKMIKALNDQISLEAFASNYYLSMASWCEVTGYQGGSKFFFHHSDEERQHMLKIINYLNQLGVKAIIPSVKQPASTFKSLEGICKLALTSEQGVTKSINKMVELAQKEKDHGTFTFLQWFVNEQIEEEELFETILQKFDLIGRDKLAVHEIDKELPNMIAVGGEGQQ